MMERYIKENDVYNLFPQCGVVERLHVAQIDELPRGDVVEVVHGEWIQESFIDRHGDTMYRPPRCSNCGRTGTFKTKYCPDCGAKMDGKGGEGK